MAASAYVNDTAGRGRAPRNEREAFASIADERLHRAVTQAHTAGREQGFQRGYVEGARAGRLAGFCWGVLLGAAAVAAALKLGWMAGHLA